MTRRILAIGRGLNQPIIQYFKTLTGRENPKICLLPTATGDHPKWIKIWENLGEKLGFDAHALPLFISSFDQKEPFDEILMNMDAIYVGGGNTVNMLAVWRAQGIDAILREAYERGILMGGGSAGGICWFENGLTDSRPMELTAMPAMGWLKGSFAPHYLSEPGRRQYYHKYIKEGSLSDGYGVDDTVGLLFEDEKMVRAVGSVENAEGYAVSLEGGAIQERLIDVEFLDNGL